MFAVNLKGEKLKEFPGHHKRGTLRIAFKFSFLDVPVVGLNVSHSHSYVWNKWHYILFSKQWYKNIWCWVANRPKISACSHRMHGGSKNLTFNKFKFYPALKWCQNFLKRFSWASMYFSLIHFNSNINDCITHCLSKSLRNKCLKSALKCPWI